MASSGESIKGVAFEDTDLTFLARVEIDRAGNLEPVLQSELNAITYKVHDGSAETGTGTATIGTSVFNTLQTGTIWTVDSTGYNFKHQVGRAAFPAPKVYRVEYLFTLTGGTQFPVVFSVEVRNLLTS